MSQRSGSQLLEQVRHLLDRGDCLAAYDLTKEEMDKGKELSDITTELAYLRVLALAQTGATKAALLEYERFQLSQSPTTDISALQARLYKDLGLTSQNPEQRRTKLAQSADLYQRLFQKTQQFYPGINAATLRILLGDTDQAQALASEVRRLAQADEASYWSLASIAEAALIEGHLDKSRAALTQAYTIAPKNQRWHASTWKNISALLQHLDIDQIFSNELRQCLHILNVGVYCGHMYQAPETIENQNHENHSRDQITALLKDLQIGTLYGSLACGSDILIAEAALNLGIETHIILPFNEADFLTHSVSPGGDRWHHRYQAVKDRATSFRFTSDQAYIHDPRQFTFASLHMQGMALMQARHLQIEAHQIALWDGQETDGPAGTAADIKAWRKHDHPSHIIPFQGLSRNLTRPAPPEKPMERVFRAIIFSDFAGFSKLTEQEYRLYVEDLLQSCGKVLKKYKDNIISQNSWGDALFIILRDPEQAAKLCHELDQEIAQNLAHSLIGDTLKGVRISAHFGPVYETFDPILAQQNCFGALVSETARMEPATPTGAIFVSETFACALEMSRDNRYECAFVGTTQLAKNYGARRLYQLRIKP